jgi:TetR/AcrR family transcriptional regulator
MEATSPRPTSTRRAADDTRERIVAAALDLFAERSFEGATMRHIAERAGVTQPLVNYHFRSKDELWRVAMDRVFARLREALEAREAGLRGVDEITIAKLIVREFITFSAANPELHRIITQECKTEGSRLDWLVDNHIRPLYDATTEVLQRLVDAGRIAPIPVAHLYYILTGAGATMFVLAPECQRLSGVDPFDPHVIEQHADAVIALLFTVPHTDNPEEPR